MLVKVLCPCGTKFAFGVEPMNGRMPAPVFCPACNADATGLANAAIAQQLGAAPPAPPSAGPPRVRLRAAAPRPEEAPPAASLVPAPPTDAQPRVRLATAQPAGAADAPEAGQGTESCSHHPSEAVAEHCRVCGKPICLKCMEMHGYACSVFCRNKAEREGIALPRYARQRSVMQQAARTRARMLMVGTVALVALLLAAWIWWAFVGTKPRVFYSLNLPKAEQGTVCELLSPTELLVIKERELVLLDLGQEKQLWTTPLTAATDGSASLPFPPNKPAPKKSAGATAEGAAGRAAAEIAKTTGGEPAASEEEDDEEWGLSSLNIPRLLTVNGGLWLQFPDRIAAYDRQTGARKHEVPLKQPLLDLIHTESAIVAVSGDPSRGRTVTWIALPAGTFKTEQIAPSADPAYSARTVQNPFSALRLSDEGDLSDLSTAPPRDGFIPAGPNVVRFQTKLLERRIETRQAMKPKSEKSLLNSGRLSAAQSLDAAIEELNDLQRSATGGVIQEDMSRYQVTLRRVLGDSPPAWTGEVVGPPAFFPLKTVDVLFGAKELAVFDRSNRKRWDARLTYAAPRQSTFGFDEESNAPCAESPDALYVFDQGMLTCFELASGQARWRLNSVGISRVQFDAEGKLYVNSTTASPDMLDFPEQFNPREKPQPVILKVDPASGKVLWKVAQIANECVLTGKFVYGVYVSGGLGGGGTHFNLYRFNPASGKPRWHYYQERWPRHMGFQGAHFMLQWRDRVEVLNYLAL